MNAVDLLIKEHQEARKAMEQIAKSRGPRKMELFLALKGELSVHDSIEEEIFYPSVATHPRLSALKSKDKDDHAVVEAALERLAGLPVDDPDWDAEFEAMRNRLLKHVADEETDFFVRIRKELPAGELDALGKRMEEEKKAWLKEA
jgi:hypothetical protein